MASPFAYLLERYPAFTQTFVVREVEEMQRQGIDATVVSLRSEEAETSRHFLKLATENVIYAPESSALVEEIKRRRAAGELPKKINQRLEAWGQQPDKLRLYEAIWTGDFLTKRGIRHVHVHFAGLAARTACLLKELYGITFSFTGHAQDIFCKTEHEISVGRLIRDARAVVTVADFSAEKLQFSYPALAYKIKRVYNGMAVPASPPPHRESGPPLILSVGRLILKKGFQDLIAACALLDQKGIVFRCEIIGDGPLEAELAQQIALAGLTEKVKLVGPKIQAELAVLLSTARVFALAAVVLPDGDSDNLPTVITEAMAAALPVVASAVAGIPEQVADGETGFLTKSGDPANLAEALEKLLTNSELARACGAAGYAKARAQFSLEETVRQLRKIVVPNPWWKIF